MTRVDFHLNTGNKLEYAVRLARKAFAAGSKLVLFGEPAILDALDERLWTFSALDFLPHCHVADRLASRTPILLTHEAAETWHHDVLVSLKSTCYPLFSRFERVIEVVASDDEDKNAARERWKYYKERGYPLSSFDLAKGNT